MAARATGRPTRTGTPSRAGRRSARSTRRPCAGARAQPHDAVAAQARAGAGAVYGLVDGPPELAAARTSWLAKPAGADRGRSTRQLAGPGRSVWMRQMVLGPAPEYAVRSNAPVDLPYESLALAATPL